jgi:hypothetical protein
MVSCNRVPPQAVLAQPLAIDFCSLLEQRECLLFDEHLPHSKEIRMIDGEHMNCDTTAGGSSDELRPCPGEMIAPSGLAWVEKPDEVASGHIMPGDVRTLVPVAVEAGQCQIVDGRGTAMLSRDNMVDVKWQGIN